MAPILSIHRHFPPLPASPLPTAHACQGTRSGSACVHALTGQLFLGSPCAAAIDLAQGVSELWPGRGGAKAAGVRTVTDTCLFICFF